MLVAEGRRVPVTWCPRGERSTLTAAVLPQAPPSAHLKSRWRFPRSGNVDYLFHQILQFQIQIQEPEVTIKSKMSLSGHRLQSVLHKTLLTCPDTHEDERSWYGNTALMIVMLGGTENWKLPTTPMLRTTTHLKILNTEILNSFWLIRRFLEGTGSAPVWSPQTLANNS